MAGNSKLQKNLGNSNQTSPLPGTNYDYETFMSSPSSSRSMSGSGDGLADDEDYEGSGGDDEGSGSAGSGSGAGENFPQSKKEAVIPDLEPCRGYLFKVSVPRCLQLLSFSITDDAISLHFRFKASTATTISALPTLSRRTQNANLRTCQSRRRCRQPLSLLFRLFRTSVLANLVSMKLL